MDKLGVLRDIYLLGSGILLIQEHFPDFCALNSLGSGEHVFLESIANSVDGMLLSAPDSLVVSITKNHGFSGDEQHNAATLVSTPCKSREKSFGWP
ncbi:hypothetical protein Acr_05g0005360 [Actinidia rufa]|uniref:Uncharacterized protein n=1 Tax=Actinidia rufa TaxID=165716 RepID=A0A7J0EMT7_9ERIC|nr:hypothetical protein Acr_05g0005360 [Actinidia rufa]